MELLEHDAAEVSQDETTIIIVKVERVASDFSIAIKFKEFPKLRTQFFFHVPFLVVSREENLVNL